MGITLHTRYNRQLIRPKQTAPKEDRQTRTLRPSWWKKVRRNSIEAVIKEHKLVNRQDQLRARDCITVYVYMCKATPLTQPQNGLVDIKGVLHVPVHKTRRVHEGHQAELLLLGGGDLGGQVIDDTWCAGTKSEPFTKVSALGVMETGVYNPAPTCFMHDQPSQTQI